MGNINQLDNPICCSASIVVWATNAEAVSDKIGTMGNRMPIPEASGHLGMAQFVRKVGLVGSPLHPKRRLDGWKFQPASQPSTIVCDNSMK